MRFARGFRLLAMLLDHLIEHCPCRQTSGIDGDTQPSGSLQNHPDCMVSVVSSSASSKSRCVRAFGSS